MTRARLLVVGGGPAAHAAAGGAREAGWREEILVLAGEPEPPYDRTLLSKRYLLEDLPRARLALPPADATVRLEATVQSLDPAAHEVRLAGGERVGYDRLLLATGARPRVLPG
ncbi:MAG: FAD-dependent oxidoreductase, partial [Candidatus Dormibacteraceae bacterium]